MAYVISLHESGVEINRSKPHGVFKVDGERAPPTAREQQAVGRKAEGWAACITCVVAADGRVTCGEL
ncbi:MAG: hypothetical protein WD009_13950 [Phycisphaeraceae bacterium]